MLKNFRSFFLLPFLLLIGCANQIGPGGGEVDKIPPKVETVYPETGTTNFAGEYIEFTFSEYVDKRSVQDAFFISPSLSGSPKLNWSGRSVKFEFPEKLQPNLTYVVTLGTDIADLNNRNRMASPFQFTFSTGSKIDKGVIQGRIYDNKPIGVMLYAYPAGDSSVNPTIAKPKYVSQAGADGKFTIQGLAEDIYRVFAVGDEFKDYLYNVGQDSYGVPYTDVTVKGDDTASTKLNFFLSKEDTTKPRLLSATMTDRFHILMEFSEDYDSSVINLNNYSIFDSTAEHEINPKYIFHGKTKSTELVLIITDSLNSENNLSLSVKTIKDKNGNVLNDDAVSLITSDKPDTSAPAVFSVKSLENQQYLFEFTDAFDSVRAKNSIRVVDRANKPYPAVINFPDDASFIIKPAQQIRQRENYFIVVDLNNIIDAGGNSTDSLYRYRFTAETQLDYTGVSGKISAEPKSQNIKVVLKPAEKGKKEYQRSTGNNMSFNIDKVEPGKYLLWSYIDKDSSNTYSYGLPFPFKESEQFSVYPDTLNLRARWPVGDIIINYSK